MERCKTATRKTRSNFQTIQEEPDCPTHGTQWPKSWAREKNLRPKTAGELRKKTPKGPRDPDLMQMTYTFDSIFGDVQKTVANLSPVSGGSNGSDEPDPLGVYRERDIVITVSFITNKLIFLF